MATGMAKTTEGRDEKGSQATLVPELAFPADEVLISRGKHSTLSRQRHEQIKRVQEASRTLMSAAARLVDDCQKKPPEEPNLLLTAENCVTNLKSAMERIKTLCVALEEFPWE